MRNIGVYSLASLIKLSFGILILVLDATMINVKDDTAIALLLALIGVFICFRGLAYFLFYRSQWLFTTKITQERMQKDAYKCSFLFGLFALINMLLIIGELWSKWIGLLCLGIFIVMQYTIFTDSKRSHNG